MKIRLPHLLVLFLLLLLNASSALAQTALNLNKSANTPTYSLVDDVIFYSYLVTSSGVEAVAGPIAVADDKETVVCPAVNTTGNNDDNLDPGEELTCTATHTVVQADIDAGSITNTATAYGDAGATISNESMVTVNYALPVLTLDKTADAITYSVAGDLINYSYLVAASGGPTPGPISVTDDKVTVTCPAVNSVGNLDNNLDPGEELTCTASYSVVADDLTNRSITNKATARGNGGATVSNEDTVTLPYLPPGTPVLTLLVSADPESFSATGQVVNYTFLIISSGNAPITGAISLINNKTTVTCPPVTSVGNNDQNLDVGESLVCTSSYVTSQTDISARSIDTVSTALGQYTRSAPVDNSVPLVTSAIPTLSQWSLMLLSVLSLLLGATYIRRKQASR